MNTSSNRRTAAMEGQIPSPCCGICRVDEQQQRCEGCMRSLDEISRWSHMDNDERLDVLKACIARRKSQS